MPHSAEDLDIDELKLAFLRDMLGRIAGADGAVTAPEHDLIDAICPPDALRAAGLVDAAGSPTALAEPAGVRALTELPRALPQEERLRLIGLLATLVVVDGEIDLREESYVAVAGYALGLSIPVLAAHLEGTGVNIVR